MLNYKKAEDERMKRNNGCKVTGCKCIGNMGTIKVEDSPLNKKFHNMARLDETLHEYAIMKVVYEDRMVNRTRTAEEANHIINNLVEEVVNDEFNRIRIRDMRGIVNTYTFDKVNEELTFSNTIPFVSTTRFDDIGNILLYNNDSGDSLKYTQVDRDRPLADNVVACGGIIGKLSSAPIAIEFASLYSIDSIANIRILNVQ